MVDQIIKYGGIDNIPLYNCSGRTPDEWSRRDGMRRPILGSVSISYGIVIEILFVPTLISMMSHDILKLSCYKIMFFIFIVDFLALVMNSIITGYLAIVGAVYCTFPHLIYISGMWGLGLWCCSCIANILLLLNRILNLKYPHLSDQIFVGNRTIFLLFIPVIYAFLIVFFNPTCVFSSKLYAWFYDPNIFENRTTEYTNLGHGFNNVMIIVVISMMNIYVGIHMLTTSRVASKRSWKAHSVLYQAILICLINQISSAIYVFMNFVPMPHWIIVFAHYLWQFDHSFPMIICLIMNKTMRRKFWLTVGRKQSAVTFSLEKPSARVPVSDS